MSELGNYVERSLSTWNSKSIKIPRLASIFVIGGIIATIAVVYFYVIPKQRVLALFRGKENLVTVTSPHRVQAFLISPMPTTEPTDKPNIARYPILSGPVEVDKDSANKIGKILASPSTYWWEAGKGCIFSPGVALTFTKGDQQVSVLFCFSCDELSIVKDGKRGMTEDFDERRRDILAVMKAIFFADKGIQALKPEGP